MNVLFLTPLLIFASFIMVAQDAFHEFNPDKLLFAKHRIRKVTIVHSNGQSTVQTINERGQKKEVFRMKDADTLSHLRIEYDSAGNFHELILDTLGKQLRKRFYYGAEGLSGISITDEREERFLSYKVENSGMELREFRNNLQTGYGQYDEAGKLVRFTKLDSNGIQILLQSYARNGRGDLTQLTTFARAEEGKRTVEKEVFTLNGRGQPLSSAEQRKGWKKSYTYKPNGLIERIEYSGSQTATITFEYLHFAE